MIAALRLDALTPRGEATVGQVRAARAMGVTRRRRRVPRQSSTIALERDYARRLLAVVSAVEQDLEDLLRELPDLVRTASAERATADSMRLDAGESRRVRELMERVRANIRRRLVITDLEDVAEETASRVATFSGSQLGRQLRAQLGVDVLQSDRGLAQLTESFVSQNVSLIRDLPNKLTNDVESTVLRGLQRGTSSRDLARQIGERLGVAERRARAIARDQIGSFNGQVNAARQQNLGITRFVWRTAQDERVRPEHADREGRVFEFADPPNGELPGEPINCRCVAEPVVSDILEGA